MRMPGSARTRLERDARATNACWVRRLEQRVNPNCPGKILGRSLSGTLRTRSFYLHLLNVVVSSSPSTLNCASLLEKKRNAGENRIKDERRDREGAIGRGRPAHEGVACLNQDQHRSENDDADLPHDRAVAFQIEQRAEKKNSDLQYKFDASIIPKTEADFQCVVIDGEIGTMNNQIEKPMRKNGEPHQQRRAVRGNAPPANFVNCKRHCRPEERADEAMRVRHVIKIQRISRGDSGNEPHLLDSKQNKWRPQKIQHLHGHEQNPERDFVSLRFDRESDAVMPHEHSSI